MMAYTAHIKCVCGNELIPPARINADMMFRLEPCDECVAKIKDQRDELLNEVFDLSCSIASAAGWDMKGETFSNWCHRMVRDNDSLKKKNETFAAGERKLAEALGEAFKYMGLRSGEALDAYIIRMAQLAERVPDPDEEIPF